MLVVVNRGTSFTYKKLNIDFHFYNKSAEIVARVFNLFNFYFSKSKLGKFTNGSKTENGSNREYKNQITNFFNRL